MFRQPGDKGKHKSELRGGELQSNREDQRRCATSEVHWVLATEHGGK